jgi:hypothetical protein
VKIIPLKSRMLTIQIFVEKVIFVFLKKEEKKKHVCSIFVVEQVIFVPFLFSKKSYLFNKKLNRESVA